MRDSLRWAGRLSAEHLCTAECVPSGLSQRRSLVSLKVLGNLPPPVDLLLSTTGTATIEYRGGGSSHMPATLVFNVVNLVAAITSITATATTGSGTQTVT